MNCEEIVVKKSKLYKILFIPLLVVVVILSPFIFWFVGSFVYIWLFTPNPPEPEITYGEFPFELIYEIDGEVVTIQDVYVCEYVGIGANEGSGKYRVWKEYIKSTMAENLILLEDGNLKLACSLGGAEYYMSDPYIEKHEFTPYIYYIIHPNEYGGTSSGVNDIESLLTQYKLKLISWKLSEPIQNSFN